MDVGTYPTFTFTAVEATLSPVGTVRIKGSLRIKDQSHPIELVATLTTPSAERVTLSGEVEIDRRQWGVSRAPMGAGVANRVVVVAQFVRLKTSGALGSDGETNAECRMERRYGMDCQTALRSPNATASVCPAGRNGF